MLRDVVVVESNIEDDPDSLRKRFEEFLLNVMKRDDARKDKEELSIIQRYKRFCIYNPFNYLCRCYLHFMIKIYCYFVSHHFAISR